MDATLRPAATATRVAGFPTALRWAGRALGALAVAFLALDAAIKVLRLPAAVEASAALGYGAAATFGLGLLALACLAAYLLPRTAPLGAVLLTGYLGGAVATHVRLGSPAFSLIFPLILGALLWVGLALRDPRLRALLAPAR